MKKFILIVGLVIVLALLAAFLWPKSAESPESEENGPTDPEMMLPAPPDPAGME